VRSLLFEISVAEKWLVSREHRGRSRITRSPTTAQEVIARGHRLARILKLPRTGLLEVAPTH
jgi:hypothetical protein